MMPVFTITLQAAASRSTVSGMRFSERRVSGVSVMALKVCAVPVTFTFACDRTSDWIS
jgi:hypothetical protein